jgi:hypothetical protein
MALTVRSAFPLFRATDVDLGDQQTKDAHRSRNYLCEQLPVLAAKVANFPRLSGECIPYGSFQRRTKIQPLDDLDLLVPLDPRGVIEVPTSTPHEYLLQVTNDSAPLSPFKGDYGFLNSTAILNRIRDSLSLIPSYAKTEPHRTHEAVRLKLTSYTWGFDIVPAVPYGGSAGIPAYYLIPTGRGAWKRTDPRVDARNTTLLNQRHGGIILPTIRLIKYWNVYGPQPRLASYHMETLALEVFRAASPITSVENGVKAFFQDCPTHLGLCPDPKGHGPALDADLAWDVRLKVKAAMIEAAQWAGYAEMYDRSGDNERAIYWWKQVFGWEFPDYG